MRHTLTSGPTIASISLVCRGVFRMVVAATEAGRRLLAGALTAAESSPRGRLMRHCTGYAFTGSRQFIASTYLDGLRRFQSESRRTWVAIGSVALLAMSCSFANAERFSIKCSEAGYFYVSFDTESAKVVEETLSGFALIGRIDKIDGQRIDFHVAIPERPDMNLVWDGSKKTLAVLAIPGDKYRTGNVFECAGTELRSMLSKYDSVPP